MTALFLVAFAVGLMVGGVVAWAWGTSRDEVEILRAELAAEREHSARLARHLLAEREYVARLIACFHEHERNTY